MSLLDNAMEPCVMLDRATASDGRGGYYSTYTEGVTFQAAITYDTSMQARIADAQGVKNLFTIYTRKEMVLDYHDVFRRISDGKAFRVTGDSNDNKTPPSAALNLRYVTAEEFVPSGEVEATNG